MAERTASGAEAVLLIKCVCDVVRDSGFAKCRIKNAECRISVGSLLKVFLLLEGLDPRRRFLHAAYGLGRNDSDTGNTVYSYSVVIQTV